jgi:hypothetical protein
VARSIITPVIPTVLGVAASTVAVDAAAAPNGMTIINVTSRTILRLITTGTIITVTIKSAYTVAGLLLADAAGIASQATGTLWLGPFASHLIQPAVGTVSGTPEVWLNFSVATGGTVEALTPGS